MIFSATSFDYVIVLSAKMILYIDWYRRRNDSGQVVHTLVPPSPRSII